MRTLFFLHIPKCAGMSLMHALLTHLPAGEVYQSTSMIRNWRENRPEFAEISNHELLRAVIGHWLHEDMLPYLSGYLIFASSLREPVARVRSQYRFDMGIRGGDFANQDKAEFLRKNRNVICNFVTRAFPSIAADFDDPTEATKAILSGMDCLFDVSEADRLQKYLMSQVGIEGVEIPRVNTSGHVTQELDATDDEILENCAGDAEVYRWFSERAAAAGPGSNPRNPVFDKSMREHFVTLRRRRPDPEPLLQHLARYYAAEIRAGVVSSERAVARLELRQRFATELLADYRRMIAGAPTS